MSGWFSRLKHGLNKTSSKLSGGIVDLFTKRPLDKTALEDLEELLIATDIGVENATRLSAQIAKNRFDQDVSPEEVQTALAEHIAEILHPVARPIEIDPSHAPHVILMCGVNGSGKTTTIGKLAKQFSERGLRVMLAAGDTFRAAAVEQLQVWGERTGCPVIARDIGADAAGLAFDAVKSAREQGMDVLLIDTAGRLQNKSHLMDELDKIVRVIRKVDPSAPHDTVLVLDATVGQNAHSQVETFNKVAPLSALVMTKLDGTAKGGVVVALAQKYAVPIVAIGVGEGADDLRPFDGVSFARSLVGL
ncbi:signal recognition particle-docking protein FtsY [Varunaivibrio sulfuroxidans]|uniref:Signal recognition particle receptor FtsY n=1 Tax=Varunaivibrio sulfuroxidans TaxID=1773489 RepID=A0A4R3JG07_9PROT|nr:signal recognition particle-docking protein FtsY [Varunaivibrio sulfuroxidans]TCS63630.1 fused signal recognition particle receptor [Varunaivibrio sulfuroxidans]WES30230.1 signal recognition particle-docking protein FtsY [Varunaivibrio sulfuroxidans]